MSHELHPCSSGKHKPEIDQLTLIPLGKDQLFLVTDWIGEKTAEALAVQVGIAPTDQSCLMICLLDNMQAVGLAEMLSSTFTDLHVPYQPVIGLWSVRFYLNSDIHLPFELQLDIIMTYVKFLFQKKMAERIVWEIHQSEVLYHCLAKQAGFTIVQQTAQFTLYGFQSDQS